MGGMDETDLPPAAACSAALVAAVARLAERLDQLPATWMASRDEILVALQQIAGDVERTCACPKQAEQPLKAGNPVLHHRLVDALRAELLTEWRVGPGSENGAGQHALLTLLWALESYRKRLWPATRNDL